jgi:hypothetical protein
MPRNNQGLPLKCWQELVGVIEKVENVGDETVLLTLLARVKVKIQSDAKVDLKKLLGQKVGVLRTDDERNEYLIRKVREKRYEGIKAKELRSSKHNDSGQTIGVKRHKIFVQTPARGVECG